MKSKMFFFIVLIIVFFVVGIAAAEQNKAAENMNLDGGRRGAVNFPHKLHQAAISDCNACHSVFPKAAGAIKDLKEKKELKSKQVMNKTCLKCHKARKKAGEKTGPTKCSACHVK